MKKLIIAFVLCLLPTLAFAQSQRNPCYYPNDYPNSGCVPVGKSNPLPVTSTPSNPLSASLIGNGFPTSSTPITGNSAGTTGAVVGTLAAAAAKTTYICGFDVSSFGSIPNTAAVTVAGLVGGSMTYQFTAGTTSTILTRSFNPCVPASAVNTAITITSPANTNATATDVNSWGYQQ